MPDDLVQRFMDKVEPEPNTGCWLWTASLFGSGYGQFSTGSRTDRSVKNRRAHRLAYELFVGAIPDGLTLDHVCRMRSCVNPRHLEPVTMRENTRRAPESISTINAIKTHCKRGHAFDSANTRLNSKGRVCRTCTREEMRRIRAARRAA